MFTTLDGKNETSYNTIFGKNYPFCIELPLLLWFDHLIVYMWFYLWAYCSVSLTFLSILFGNIIPLKCLGISTDISSNLISYSTLSNLNFNLFIVFLVLIIIIFILRSSAKFFFQICVVIPDSLLLLITIVILSFISTNILYHSIFFI